LCEVLHCLAPEASAGTERKVVILMTPQPEEDARVEGFLTGIAAATVVSRVIHSPSWGAFAFGPIYLAAMRAWWHALILFLAQFVGRSLEQSATDAGSVYLGAVVQLVPWIIYTWTGKRLAWSHRRWRDFDDYLACQRLWDKWAKGVAVTMLALLLIVVGYYAGRTDSISYSSRYTLTTTVNNSPGLGPQAPVPNVPSGEEFVARQRLELELQPKEEKYIEFPVANVLTVRVACAFGTVTFTWSVRKPYPAPEGTVEFFNEYQGAHESYGASNMGTGRTSFCRPILVVNRSAHQILVEVHYAVSYLREGVLSPRP
jgi:hypothetical protein